MTPECAYTIATGKLFCPFQEFHTESEKLLGRPIFTHEFADPALWEVLKGHFESKAITKMSVQKQADRS